MAGKLIDITSQRFGYLIVVGLSHIKEERSYWKVKCDCGTEKIVYRSCLISGKTKSCGKEIRLRSFC